MFPLGKVLVFLVLVCSTKATRSFRKLILSVEPNPALIHINAPPGTPILSITGYDAATGQRLEQVQITNTPDASYFMLKDPIAGDNKWYLYSKQFMNKPLNYVFRFRVYGTHQGTVQDQEIKIKVSKPNLYPPVFENQTYEFIAYRKSADLDIQLVGTVQATDADFEMYNSKFDYFIFDTQVLGLFNVDSSGKVIIVSKQNFPDDADSYTFSIVAIDAGSPQKMSNITVNVKISDIPPPDIFCVSVEGVKAKFCWKDPTHGQFVNNYQLQFTVNDKNITTRPVAIHGKRNEICTSVSGQHMERSYRFTVQIFNGTDRSPASVQRFVNISKPGLYGDCLNFSNCSIWKPCRHGKCLTKKDMSYECDCFQGWIGRNCTVKDPCLPSPCMNNGQCNRTEKNGFQCQCAHGYFGKYCHQKDSCVGDPCLNQGSCSSKTDGSYECHCRPHFTGQHCEVTDPCSPSPCNHTGLCHRLTNTEYVCSCLQGYYGDDCENINKCELHNPCKSGWCVHIDHNQFNCTCYKGSSGKYCNITDACMINTCKNGATCVPIIGNTVKKYDCQCSRGYHGDECQHYDPCSSNPCQFGGVCRALSDQLYRCECKQERYGENCQYVDGCKIHKCGANMVCQNTSLTGAVDCLCNSSPCRQGGTCTIGYNSQPYCKCKSGYSGTSCERSCSRDSCLNEGTCEIIDGSYECVCPDNFFGTRCENYDFCNATRMCIRGARCHLTQKTYHHLIVINQTMTANVTNWYTCSHCPVGYTEPTTDSVRWNLTSAAERHDVSCLSDSISVFIPSDLLSHYQTTWRDPHCQVQDNGTHYVSTISHTSCGTTVIFTKDEVIFENELILHKSGSPSNQTSNGSIDFGSSDSEVIPVQCIYPRRQNISTLYRPAQSTVRFYEKRYGHMDVQLEQYKSGMFVTPLPVRSFPNEVEINKDMYFILHAMHVNSTDVAVKVDSCVATPSNMPADGRIYQLLDQGCPASPAVKVYPSAFDEVRFSVRAFEFRTSPGGIVYIHCQVSVCSPTSPQCRVGCAHRHRREVSTEDGGSHLVSGGPYLLVADKGGLQVSTVVAGVCASVAVVATVIAIIGWRRKSSASTSSSKL